MKILSRKDIEKIAERVLKAYKNLPENINTDITHIDPELLLTNLLGFNLEYTHFFACGPEPMLKALSDNTETSGQLSFEERMGCGFGACMGCTCKTKYGNKRICKEGPVLIKEEIIW